jgi:Signal peptidase, peptidase S26
MGAVLVNGSILYEPYDQGSTLCASICFWEVPHTEGDVSISHQGSEPRSGPGPPAENEWCALKGCYFVLGDNRQNNSGSRQGWLVPAENIRGFVEVD